MSIDLSELAWHIKKCGEHLHGQTKVGKLPEAVDYLVGEVVGLHRGLPTITYQWILKVGMLEDIHIPSRPCSLHIPNHHGEFRELNLED